MSETNFKQKLESNFWVVLAGAIIVAVSTVGGVMSHLHSKELALVRAKHDLETASAEIEKKRLTGLYESRLSSVHRQVGDSEYLDVRRLIIRKSELASVPLESHFYLIDNFYAASQPSELDYQQTTMAEFMKSINDGEPNDTDLKIGQLSPLHVWRSRKSHRVQNSDVITNAFACVCLQKAPIDKLREIVHMEIDSGDKSDDKEKTKLRRENADKTFQGDVIGALFATHLGDLFLSSTYLSNTHGELLTVQKIDNVVYSQIRITLDDAVVDDVKYSHYFIIVEDMMVSLPPYVYFIMTTVPTSDPSPRGEQFAAISKWMTNLRMVAD